MGIELSAESWQVLIAFGCYLVGVALLGYFSHRFLSRGAFVNEYFLGNRGLGPWVLALTIAATAISGGTFMGFPSLIYTNGWIMALWIASYMVAPMAGMALMSKRINQVSRISGSVTVPDVLRDRFQSPALGILASLLILVFLMVNLVAQFKAGGSVLKEALDLPPARAEFLKVSLNEKDQVLFAHFKMQDGREVKQKALLADNQGRPQDTRLDPAPPERPTSIIVTFDSGSEKRVFFPPQEISVPLAGQPLSVGYVIGVLIFAITVIAYTTYGGFWAVTLTDVLEGLVMLAGVIIMAILAVRAVPAVSIEREIATPHAKAHEAWTEPTKAELTGLAAATERLRQQDPALVYGPGPGNYLPLGMAFSFFLMWSLISAGQPSGMVRLMSFKDSASARRAMMLICFYYALTYLCLIVIFICARAIFPTEYLREAGSEARGEPDSIMPAMARHLADPVWAGLLLAAPYAAIMSTVAAFLLMISSSLVRDLYQRVINPKASDRTLRISSYLITGLVGGLVLIGALNPPNFLQYIIVFTGSGLGSAFLIPMLLTLYWRRATKAGVLAAMLGGFGTVVSLYALGWMDSRSQRAISEYRTALDGNAAAAVERPDTAYWLNDTFGWVSGWGDKRHDPFNPIFLFGVDTPAWGLLMSLLLGVGVSLLTRTEPEQVRKYFPEEAA